MALRLHPSANLDTTPLHLPIAAPLLPSQTNTDAAINASKRPRLVDNIDTEFLQHHAQQEPFYEHLSTVEAQLLHHQDQLQQPDWAVLQLQLDAQPQEQQQFQQLQQLQHSQHSQHSEEILTDGAGFLSYCHGYLPEQAPEEAQFVSPHLNHQPLYHPEQQLTPHLNHQHLHHPEQQLSPPSPALAFDPSLAFLHGPVPMSSVVALPPGAFQQHPPTVLMAPPPPPPPPLSPPAAAKPHVNTTHRPRAPITSTSATAAAALSSSSASAALAFASSSSATASACALRLGGYTLEEAGIKLPPGLSDAERRRRLRLIAEELHHEATHPPVLPPSQVPDLPEKPPPVPLPKLTPGMTPAQRAATGAEILRLSQAQKKADQSRNNLAAKKSRMLRLECLENTRLQLNAKSAECIWLRVQIVALAGEPLPRRPSEAWGGFDYVYRARKRRRRRLRTLLEDGPDGGGGGLPVKVEDKEGREDEGEDEDEPDVEGIVPRRVKEAITEEVRARVEAHKEAVEEDSKRKTSASRTARRSEAAKAEAAKAEAEAAGKTDKGGRQRRGSGGGKRKH